MKKELLFCLIILILILAGCTSNNTTKKSISESNQYQAEIINGVQEVTLSWGKLNYRPEQIIVNKGIPVRITADTDRLTGCFRSFEIPAFGVSKLFTPSSNTVEFTPDKTGNYQFSCSMGMGRGVIKVI